MEIILTRHGETDYNVKGLIQGQRKSRLTENGIKQSKVLAKALKNKKIDVIYTSKLKRAVKTAEIINNYHKLKIKRLDVLNERNFGKLEGKKGTNIHKLYPDALKNPFFRPENGENFEDVIKRVKPFVKKILKKNNRTILILAHKIINLAILCILLKKDIKEAYRLKQDPVCINKLLIKNKKVYLKVFNNTDHLKKRGITKVKEIEGIC